MANYEIRTEWMGSVKSSKVREKSKKSNPKGVLYPTNNPLSTKDSALKEFFSVRKVYGKNWLIKLYEDDVVIKMAYGTWVSSND